MKGKLIVFEGADGTGKTSLIEIIGKRLNEKKLNCKIFSFPGKSEGSLGEMVYKIHHNTLDFFLKELNPTSLQLLHIAAHIDSIAIIYPLYQSGNIILLDRYWWSTYVYGKVAGINKKILRKMIEIEYFYWNEIYPDMIFLIDRKSNDYQNEIIFREYTKLAVNEKDKYKIIKIDNNSTINYTCKKILKIINEYIK